MKKVFLVMGTVLMAALIAVGAVGFRVINNFNEMEQMEDVREEYLLKFRYGNDVYSYKDVMDNPFIVANWTDESELRMFMTIDFEDGDALEVSGLMTDKELRWRYKLLGKWYDITNFVKHEIEYSSETISEGFELF
jgi:hypothetical protein